MIEVKSKLTYKNGGRKDVENTTLERYGEERDKQGFRKLLFEQKEWNRVLGKICGNRGECWQKMDFQECRSENQTKQIIETRQAELVTSINFDGFYVLYFLKLNKLNMNKEHRNCYHHYNLHEQYISSPKLKLHLKNVDQNQDLLFHNHKHNKIHLYVPRKKSYDLLKTHKSHSKDSVKSLAKQEKEQQSAKTVHQKRWENQFKYSQQRLRNRMSEHTAAKNNQNVRSAKRMNSKITIKQSKQGTVSAQQQELLTKTKTVLKSYQRQLCMIETQKKKLMDENNKLKQILSEYMEQK